jgi:hypothetical protein
MTNHKKTPPRLLRRRYFINGKLSQAFGGWVVVVVVFMSALFMFIKLKSHPLVRDGLTILLTKQPLTTAMW